MIVTLDDTIVCWSRWMTQSSTHLPTYLPTYPPTYLLGGNAETLAQGLDPGSRIDTREQDKEHGGVVAGLLVGGLHVEGLLEDVFRAHHSV